MSKSFQALYRENTESLGFGTTAAIVPISSSEGDQQLARSNYYLSVAAVLRHLHIDISSNSCNGDTIISIYRKNLTTALSITVAASSTGWKSNLAEAVQFAAGEAYRVVVDTNASTSGSIAWRSISYEIDPDTSSNTLTVIGANSFSETAITGASETGFITPHGARGASTTESDVSRHCPIAGTLSYFATYVGANARTTDTTFNTRVAGSTGTPEVTITSSDTALHKLDSTNTQSVAADDDINYRYVTGTGTELMNLEKCAAQINNSSDLFYTSIAAGAGGSNAISASTTYYLPPSGELSLVPSTTESDAQIKAAHDCDIVEIFGRLAVNSFLSGTTVTLRVNGVDTALTFSIGTLSTAVVSDTGSVSVSAGDLLSLKVETGTAGTTSKIQEFGAVYDSGGVTGGASVSTDLRMRQMWTVQNNTSDVNFSHTFDDNGGEGALPDAGNLLVFGVSIRGGGDSFTTPTGWTLLDWAAANGNMGYAWYYREATGDSNDDISLDFVDNGRVYAWIEEHENADFTTAVLNGSNEDETNLTTSVTSQQTGSVTPSDTDQKLAIAFLGAGQATGTGLWSDTEDGDVSIDSGFTMDAVVSSISTRPCAAVAHKIIESTAALNPTFSTTEAGGYAFGALAVFNGVTAGGSTPRTITTSFGALVQKQGLIASASAGAMLQKQQSATASLDAAIQKAQALTASMGATLQGGVANTADADALLQKAVTVTASLDAALMANIAASTDADALLQKAVQVSATLDAILLQIGAVSASADAMLQKPQTATAGMDSALQKPLLETATLGALLQAGVTGAADLDALLQKPVTLTASMDAVLTAIGSSIRTAQIDALLRREGVTITTAIGAVLQKARSLSASVDAVLAKAYTLTFGAGSLLQRGVSAAAGLNAIITLNGVVLSQAGGGVISCRGASAVNSGRSTSAEMTDRSTTSEITYRP